MHFCIINYFMTTPHCETSIRENILWTGFKQVLFNCLWISEKVGVGKLLIEQNDFSFVRNLVGFNIDLRWIHSFRRCKLFFHADPNWLRRIDFLVVWFGVGGAGEESYLLLSCMNVVITGLFSCFMIDFEILNSFLFNFIF